MSQAIQITNSANRHLRSIMVSPAPEALCVYYNQLGLDFRELKDKGCFFSYKQPLIIFDAAAFENIQGLSCGLAICERGVSLDEGSKNRSGPELSFKFTAISNVSFILAHFILDQPYFDSMAPIQNKDAKENWVHVLRSANIEQAKDFYDSLGPWQLERHGQGPLHYSLTDHPSVFELYPLRKLSSATLEYIILASASSPVIQDPDGRSLRFLEDMAKVI